MKQKWFNNRTTHRMSLGELYLVSPDINKHHVCRLVKVTPKGYNLLDIDTNKCVIYPHLYPYKKVSNEECLVFYVPIWIRISKVKLTNTG